MWVRYHIAVVITAIDGSVALADRGRKQTGSVTIVRSVLGVRRIPFPARGDLVAVRWYLRYGLSYRDLEELLAERGIEVDHVTVYRWVQRFTPVLLDAARPCPAPGRGSLVRRRDLRQGLLGGGLTVYRAVDQHGQVIDVYVSTRVAIPGLRGRSSRAALSVAR